MDDFMLKERNYFMKRPARAFTLIEIMVVVAIIFILITLLLAVGSSVSRKSKISATRTTLKTLEGIVEEFQRDNGPLAETLYATDGHGLISEYSGGGVTA